MAHPLFGAAGKGSLGLRPRRSPRRISLLVGEWLTKAAIRSWSERTISHTGTETRPRLLREAAVGNLALMRETVTQRRRVREEGLRVVNLFQEGRSYSGE